MISLAKNKTFTAKIYPFKRRDLLFAFSACEFTLETWQLALGNVPNCLCQEPGDFMN